MLRCHKTTLFSTWYQQANMPPTSDAELANVLEELLEEGEDVEDYDFVKGLLWQHHPVRELLFNALINREIPTDHKLMGPNDVWNKYCDNDIFEGMEYDATFKRWLLALRKQVKEGKDRADQDLKSFNIAKKNHPPPPRNHRDEPQWSGSEAQRLLKMDMDNKRHFDLKPEQLWESRPEHGEFFLSTFRDHVWQEHKTRKRLYTLKLRAKEKAEKRIADAKKKQAIEDAKRAATEDKKVKAAEKQAEKERKLAERDAERVRKAAEKQAEKERKAAAREAERVKKAAEKQAEKERKAAAKAAADAKPKAQKTTVNKAKRVQKPKK